MINDIYRLHDCISDGKQNISYSLFCSSAVSKCIYKKNEIYSVAPGENKHPVSFMKDKQCEELTFPILFPKGRYGYTAERKIKVTPAKYFNARLLH